jgi:hypothetical protein
MSVRPWLHVFVGEKMRSLSLTAVSTEFYFFTFVNILCMFIKSNGYNSHLFNVQCPLRNSQFLGKISCRCNFKFALVQFLTLRARTLRYRVSAWTSLLKRLLLICCPPAILPSYLSCLPVVLQPFFRHISVVFLASSSHFPSYFSRLPFLHQPFFSYISFVLKWFALVKYSLVLGKKSISFASSSNICGSMPQYNCIIIFRVWCT